MASSRDNNGDNINRVYCYEASLHRVYEFAKGKRIAKETKLWGKTAQISWQLCTATTDDASEPIASAVYS